MANRFGGRRMRKQWSAIAHGTADFTTNAVTVVSGIGGSPFTVLRMIGEYVLDPTAAPGVNDECIISVGIAVISDDAFVTGSTAVPEPGTDPGYPWLYWGSHVMSYRTTGLDPAAPGAGARIAFDVKSMRRLVAAQTLALIVQYEDVAGAPPTSFTIGNVRVLSAFG